MRIRSHCEAHVLIPHSRPGNREKRERKARRRPDFAMIFDDPILTRQIAVQRQTEPTNPRSCPRALPRLSARGIEPSFRGSPGHCVQGPLRPYMICLARSMLTEPLKCCRRKSVEPKLVSEGSLSHEHERCGPIVSSPRSRRSKGGKRLGGKGWAPTLPNTVEFASHQLREGRLATVVCALCFAFSFGPTTPRPLSRRERARARARAMSWHNTTQSGSTSPLALCITDSTHSPITSPSLRKKPAILHCRPMRAARKRAYQFRVDRTNRRPTKPLLATAAAGARAVLDLPQQDCLSTDSTDHTWRGWEWESPPLEILGRNS